MRKVDKAFAFVAAVVVVATASAAAAAAEVNVDDGVFVVGPPVLHSGRQKL